MDKQRRVEEKESQWKIFSKAHVLLFPQHMSSEAKKVSFSKRIRDRGSAVYNPQ